MKVSARNVFKGKIVGVQRGAVNAEVTLELPGGNRITSIITLGSLDSLELREGKEAYALIKASSVLLAVD